MILDRIARCPGLRVLASVGNELYASRGYTILRTALEDPVNLDWHSVAHVRPSLRRRASITNRLTARLFRDGFHALTVLRSGVLIGAVPGSIVTLLPGQNEFHETHAITRGTRPLHITSVPNGIVYWGEYFDNAGRDEVHIYASVDDGKTWSPAYTFPKGTIRHVHNIVHDPWGNCLWILTGDYRDECRILRASYDLSQVEVVMKGNQQARAVAAVPTENALYFSSDTPLESNHIYELDRQRKLTRLSGISSSSIYGCRVGTRMFFSTMVEPSEANPDRNVRLFGAEVARPDDWQPLLAWQKDFLSMGLFQYGNAFLPDGQNDSPYLALSTIAVDSDDMVLSLYRIREI
ncbi:MAG TPA: hypothetical protein VMS18_11300 [Candidatus Binatia bacterium]|nr:hypothetical protein [Candidatus Binatia bacterium]